MLLALYLLFSAITPVVMLSISTEKKKPSGRFGVRSFAEAHCVKLTEIAVQYATAVVQVLNIMAMK